MAPSMSLTARACFPFSVKTRSDEKKCQNQLLCVGIGDDTLKSIGTRIRLALPNFD
jgi:hypothetical protein